MEWNVHIKRWNDWLLHGIRSARMEETSMNEIKSINQYSKLISIEQTGMNQVDWHFEDLEYLGTINIQYSEILFNVTERGKMKLDPWESMDVRFGRSTFSHFNHFIFTSHCQWTGIIIHSIKCTKTKCNGL